MNNDNILCIIGPGERDPTYRLKWNWLYVIALNALVSNGTSSPLGTLYQFITNPMYSKASSDKEVSQEVLVDLAAQC